MFIRQLYSRQKPATIHDAILRFCELLKHYEDRSKMKLGKFVGATKNRSEILQKVHTMWEFAEQNPDAIGRKYVSEPITYVPNN